jgi:hypothetical protein
VEQRLSVQRACRVVRLSRTAFYQPPLPASRRDAVVIAALTEAVARYPRWGCWKLYDRLRAEGRPWNHKRVHRVYCALRLNLPRRTTRRVPRRLRQPLAAPPVLNATWALDFMADALYDGRPSAASRCSTRGIAKAWRSRSGRHSRVDASCGCSASWSPCMAGPPRSGSTTALNSPRSPSRLVCRARHRLPLHPAGQARPERLHRALQPHLSHGGPQCPSLRIDRRAAGPDARMAPGLQPRTAPRQPWPGAAPGVSAEAYNRRSVSVGTVRLTGKLTPVPRRASAGRPNRS